MRTKQLTGHQNQKALSCIPLLYSLEEQSACEPFDLLAKLILVKDQPKNLNFFAEAIAVRIFHNNTPSRKGHSPEMACEDHAVPFHAESSANGNTQRGHLQGTPQSSS